MAAFRTGAATSRHDIVRQTLLTHCVTALFAFAELPAKLDHRDFLAARVTFFFLWFTHSFSFQFLVIKLCFGSNVFFSKLFAEDSYQSSVRAFRG